jgi:FecR protein
MAGRWTPSVAIGAAAVVVGLMAPVGASAQGDPAGAPKQAEVRFTSLMGLPAPAYVTCGGLAACTTSGNIDLTTTSEVDTVFGRGVTRGVAPLPFSSAQGVATRSYSCGGDGGTFVSRVEPSSTIAGELEIAGIEAVPGTNALSVALNTAGDTGNEFPQEIVNRTDGGCGVPEQAISQTMGLWYFHFYSAHRETQDDITNDLVLSGLAYDSAAGVFATDIERFVNVDAGGNVYPVYEDTRIEVEPEYCSDKAYQITSATANGQSLGLDGMRFYPGQVVTTPAGAKVRLGDGSVVETDKGGSFHIDQCETGKINFHIRKSIGSFWANVKKALGGGRAKFDVTTERAVAGVRGTIFDLSYKEAKELTRVEVEEGEVSMKGINGAKGKVIVQAGEVGVQKGKKAPKIVSG